MSISNLKLTITEQFLIIKQKLFGTEKSQLRILLVVGVMIFVVAAVTIVVWPREHPIDCNKTITRNCIIMQAKDNLDPKDVAKLQKIIPNLQKVKYYDQDPNLLYILTVYYINLSDGVNAKKYYDKFMNVYSPDDGLSTSFDGHTQDINQITQTVDYLQAPQGATQYSPGATQ